MFFQPRLNPISALFFAIVSVSNVGQRQEEREKSRRDTHNRLAFASFFPPSLYTLLTHMERTILDCGNFHPRRSPPVLCGVYAIFPFFFYFCTPFFARLSELQQNVDEMGQIWVENKSEASTTRWEKREKSRGKTKVSKFNDKLLILLINWRLSIN